MNFQFLIIGVEFENQSLGPKANHMFISRVWLTCILHGSVQRFRAEHDLQFSKTQHPKIYSLSRICSHHITSYSKVLLVRTGSKIADNLGAHEGVVAGEVPPSQASGLTT